MPRGGARSGAGRPRRQRPDGAGIDTGSTLRPPASLSAGGRAVWIEVIGRIDRTTIADGPIETYCEALARHRLMCTKIAERGIVDAAGKLNPVSRTIEATAHTVRDLAHDLGLIPRKRTAPAAKEGDGWADVLNRARALSPNRSFQS
jgi:phage terminase small subunit